MTSICIRKNFHGVPGFIYAFFRVPGIPFVKIAYTRATGGGLPHAMPAELYSQFWAKGDRLRLGNLEAHTPAMPSASSSGCGATAPGARLRQAGVTTGIDTEASPRRLWLSVAPSRSWCARQERALPGWDDRWVRVA
jgi:hypothetical protein